MSVNDKMECISDRSDVAVLLLQEISLEAKEILYAGYKLRLALICHHMLYYYVLRPLQVEQNVQLSKRQIVINDSDMFCVVPILQQFASPHWHQVSSRVHGWQIHTSVPPLFFDANTPVTGPCVLLIVLVNLVFF